MAKQKTRWRRATSGDKARKKAKSQAGPAWATEQQHSHTHAQRTHTREQKKNDERKNEQLNEMVFPAEGSPSRRCCCWGRFLFVSKTRTKARNYTSQPLWPPQRKGEPLSEALSRLSFRVCVYMGGRGSRE